jgi:hypothetical protein
LANYRFLLLMMVKLKLRAQAVAIAVVLHFMAKLNSPPKHSTTSSYETNVTQSSSSLSVEVAQAIIASNKTKTAIWHFPSHREICVKLDYARCPHPDLLGKISGSSLAVLDDWKNQSRIVPHKNGTVFDTLYCGSYKNAWLPPGHTTWKLLLLFVLALG